MLKDSGNDTSFYTATALPGGIENAQRPLPPGITPVEDMGKQSLTTRDYHVNNPMDQAAIDTLLYNIVCDERDKMADGARLFILLGENHLVPGHKMTQAGLVDNLCADRARHGSIKLAVESPFNFLTDYLQLVYQKIVPQPLKDCFHDFDMSGHLYAQAVMAKNYFTDAPQSYSQLLSRAGANDIEIVPYDTGKKTPYLDPQDPLVRKVCHEIDGCIGLHKTVSDHGVKIRNKVMARRILEAADTLDNPADTIVIQTGLKHLGGCSLQDLCYPSSLSARLKDTMRPHDRLISVFFSSVKDKFHPEDVVSPDMWEDNPDHVIIRNASDAAFRNGEEDEEMGHIQKLGESYKAAVFGGIVPERFKAASPPSVESVENAVDRLIAENTP